MDIVGVAIVGVALITAAMIDVAAMAALQRHGNIGRRRSSVSRRRRRSNRRTGTGSRCGSGARGHRKHQCAADIVDTLGVVGVPSNTAVVGITHMS